MLHLSRTSPFHIDRTPALCHKRPGGLAARDLWTTDGDNMREKGNETEFTENVIGTITNQRSPEQSVKIKYVQTENAFITSGIQAHLGMKEILIPAHLVAIDFQLVGAIISAILERISLAQETETPFAYANRFEVLDKTYTLMEYGDYMKLEWE
jgi:hypothetical protein